MVVDGRGSERVDGRFRPGKEVRRTLTVDKAMIGQLRVCVDRGFETLMRTEFAVAVQ